MKFKNRFKKYLMGAALAMTLTMASVMPAYAVDINISPGDYTSTAEQDRFTAYQIFKGTPNDEGNVHALTGITWGDGIEHAQLITALTTDSSTALGTAFTEAYNAWNAGNAANKGNDAAFVARFLSEHEDLAKDFAAVAADYVIEVKGHTSTFATDKWVISGVEDGYYLIIDKVSPDTAESTSSYILDVAGDQNITMKSTIPTVEKSIEDKPGNITESNKVFKFTLTGTVAENIDEYTTYSYKFVDTIPVGLTVDKDTVAVTVDAQTVQPSAYTTELTPENSDASQVQTLTISFDDLLDDTSLGVTVSATSKIVVTYDAYLNKYATAGTTGNLNKVDLEFSNDPYSQQEGKTTSETKTYEFGLDITKYNGSEEAETPLDNVQFILKNSSNKYAAMEQNESTYVVKSWEDADSSATTMTTANGGKLVINGLGVGTYTLHEVQAPTGFDPLADVTFTITGSVNEESGALEGFNATLNETRTDAEITDNDSNGVFEVKLTNYESPVLPSTGGAGTTALYLVSITIGVVGVTGLVIALRKRKNS